MRCLADVLVVAEEGSSRRGKGLESGFQDWTSDLASSWIPDSSDRESLAARRCAIG